MRRLLKYKLFSIGVGVSLCSSCAREEAIAPASSSSASQASHLLKVEPVGSFREALQIVESTSLRCASLSECPAFVGMLLAADKPGGFDANSNSVGACTATLVGEDLALTNSHCIPSAVKLLPDLCPERIRIVLPGTDSQPAESVACAGVIRVTEPASAISPDLALLRLAGRSKRPVPPLSREGVSDSTALKSFKVNPNLKQLSGELRNELCVSAAHSYRMPIYKNASSPALVLGDCTSVSGNSGGPLLNEKGELVALLQAALPISLSAQKEWLAHLEGETSFASLALGTSLVCLSADLPAWAWNSECIGVSEQDVLLSRPRIREQLGSVEMDVARLLAPYHAQTKLLRWERTAKETRALRRQESLLPLCVNAPSHWEDDFRASPKGEALAAAAEIPLAFPILFLELRFNRFLQPLPPRAVLASEEKRKYIFSPRKTFSEGILVLSPIDQRDEPLTMNACQ